MIIMKKKSIIIVLIIFAIIVVYYALNYSRHHQPIPTGAVSLEFPLKGESFQAIQSGPKGKTHTLPVEKYALDITKPIKLGDFLKFRKSDLESNTTFGTPIYSPCAGNVTIAVDGFNDMPIGISGSANESNHVTVDCGQFYVAMVHFKKDTILVKVGDIVKVGQEIGLVGNSGHSSAPHLHLMAYKIGSNSNDKIALPITFNGKYLFRGDIYP